MTTEGFIGTGTSKKSTGAKQKLRAFLALGRVSNGPTLISNSLAGAALAGVTVVNARVLLSALALFCFYVSGMFLNDIFDLEWDRKERQDRPLVEGRLTVREAWIGTFCLWGMGFTLLFKLGPLPLLAGVPLLFLIMVYDRWHKNNPLAPVIMSLCRVMVYLIAFFCFSSQATPTLMFVLIGVMLYVSTLSFIARFETRKNFKPLVGYLIAGLSLVDALIVAVWGGLMQVGICVAAFFSVIFLHRIIKGT